MAEKKYSINVTLDRFEGKLAVLIADDGREILWPALDLPEDAKEGVVLKLTLGTNQTETEEKEKLAKSLLNEILKKD